MVDDTIPHVLDKESLMMTEIIQSDEDLQCYGSVDRHLKMPEIKQVEADGRLYKWYKVMFCVLYLFVMF